MVSIKGPRSALTDYLEEYHKRSKKQTSSGNKAVQELISGKKKGDKKSICHSQPCELGNYASIELSLQEIALSKVFETFSEEMSMDSNQLDLFAKYLGRNRLMDLRLFNFFVAKSELSLKIYDCSMIREDDFLIEKNFTSIELGFCGQLTTEKLQHILRFSPNLQKLKIYGAFKVRNFLPPASIKELDVSHCTKLNDEFIDGLNNVFTHIESLNISNCDGLSENIRLNFSVCNLDISSTNVSDMLIGSLDKPNILELNISNCKNISISSFLEFHSLQSLFLDNQTYISKLNLPKKLVKLSISGCMNILNIPRLPKITELNVAKTSLTKKSVLSILNNKELSILNISWSKYVDDDFILKMIANKNMKRVLVFGCFELTEEIGELAWTRRKDIRIIGNPSETSFLLNSSWE